ncbi:MAG: protein translocase subunit SecF [Acidimicrobiia bacterium]
MSIRSTMHAVGEGTTTYPFVERRWRWWILSLVLLAISLVSLFTRGLNLGIDFEGGTSFLVKSENADPTVGGVRDVLGRFDLSDAKVAILGDDTIRVQTEELDPGATTVTVTVDEAGPTLDAVDAQTASIGLDLAVEEGDAVIEVSATRELDESDQERLTDAIGSVEGVEPGEIDVVVRSGGATEVAVALADYAGVEPRDVSISEVGPTFGKTVAEKARNALVLFFGAVALYLTMRFRGNWKMAVSALLAEVHDIAITVGVYSVTGFEVTPATVIAFLTILGFSLYDTVVVFDRVDENLSRLTMSGRQTYSDVVDRSMNEVLARSLSTSLVAILPVTSLLVMGTYVFGAPAILEFALALFVGIIAGTYSSIFVATPILAVWKEREPRYRDLRHRVEAREAARPKRVNAVVSAAVDAVPTDAAEEPEGHGSVEMHDDTTGAAHGDVPVEDSPSRRTATPGTRPDSSSPIAPRGRKRKRRKKRR